MTTPARCRYDGWSAEHFNGPVYKRMLCAQTTASLAVMLRNEARLKGWKPAAVDVPTPKPFFLTDAEHRIIAEHDHCSTYELANMLGRSRNAIVCARDRLRRQGVIR